MHLYNIEALMNDALLPLITDAKDARVLQKEYETLWTQLLIAFKELFVIQ